jgi:tripartite-type tricarboxylate transporter receptor subunit TctC
MRKSIQSFLALSAIAAVFGTAQQAVAQSYPSRPITLILGFAPGGSSDVSTRVMATEMTTVLGQSVVVENRPGGVGIVALEAIARAQPDGYTGGVVFAAFSPIMPMTVDVPRIEAARKVAFVSRMSIAECMLLARKDFPADTVQQVIAYAQANPGKVNYGHGGTNGVFHLFGALLAQKAGVKMEEVGYKGDGPAVQGAMSGEVDLAIATVAAAATQVKAGRVKGIASIGATRSPVFPELPTVAESGYPGYTLSLTQLIAIAPGTPAPLVETLNAAARKALGTSRIREEFAKFGMVPSTSSPAEATAEVKEALDNSARLIERVKPFLK